jgi:hypothetical protein
VILLHLADNDRSFSRHVPLMNGNLAAGEAHADVQA